MSRRSKWILTIGLVISVLYVFRLLLILNFVGAYSGAAAMAESLFGQEAVEELRVISYALRGVFLGTLLIGVTLTLRYLLLRIIGWSGANRPLLILAIVIGLFHLIQTGLLLLVPVSTQATARIAILSLMPVGLVLFWIGLTLKRLSHDLWGLRQPVVISSLVTGALYCLTIVGIWGKPIFLAYISIAAGLGSELAKYVLVVLIGFVFLRSLMNTRLVPAPEKNGSSNYA